MSNGASRGGFGGELRPGERDPARYAASFASHGERRHREEACATRGPFQRDRDRILHSTAFRRLTYKTQVFVFREDDHYRNRLTHSLEVAQVSRAIARQLRLDEDLAEALALAHDLGHSPFGHAGERALNRALSAFGGFDHNAQSLRVVTRLERKYLTFDGLNLTWETLEGLAKHNGPIFDAANAVAKVARALEPWRSLDLGSFASGEAQVAALADDIAYVTHDIDDGLRAGLLALSDLEAAPLAGAVVSGLRGTSGAGPRAAYEISRRMITALITDVVAESRARLASLNPQGAGDIRQAGAPTVAFSRTMETGVQALKAFLHERVYRHPKVAAAVASAEGIVDELFLRYFHDPSAMPEEWRELAFKADEKRRARLIGDFVAGMTDRYALAERRRLFEAPNGETRTINA